jgi:hypothetical protein
MMEHQGSDSTNSVRSLWLGAVLCLLGVVVVIGPAFAAADCGESEPPPKPAKSRCPAGYKFSAKKRSCAKVSCGTGRAWSGAARACVDRHTAALTDDDLYAEARLRVEQERFAEAFDLLQLIKNQEQAKVLNYIGYTTRKLGDVDKGLEYYQRALTLDPNYTRAREYLGEGYLQKGDLDKAKEQLVEIADRCGGSCEDYAMLEKAIMIFATGESKPATW